MIRLRKLEKPNILEVNEVAWRDEYLVARESGGPIPSSVEFRYRHPQIKERIKEETHEKCAYCESKVTHVAPGDTEHMLPRNHRPELIVDWDNLTFVCRWCNQYKSDYYSETEPLLHPYEDDPADHLLIFGPLVLPRPGDDKGFRTYRKLRLTRMPLVERKKELVESLRPLIDDWLGRKDGPTRELVRQQLLEFGAPDREFSATVRAYLAATLGWEFD